jgi:hypothetical protein
MERRRKCATPRQRLAISAIEPTTIVSIPPTSIARLGLPAGLAGPGSRRYQEKSRNSSTAPPTGRSWAASKV